MRRHQALLGGGPVACSSPKWGPLRGGRGWAQTPLPAQVTASASTPDGQRCPAGCSLGEVGAGESLGGCRTKAAQHPMPVQYQPPGCSSTITPGGDRGPGSLLKAALVGEREGRWQWGGSRVALSPGRAESALPNCPKQRGSGCSEERRGNRSSYHACFIHYC